MRALKPAMLLGLFAGVLTARCEPPSIYNSQEETIPPLRPEEALQRIKLPEGFRATLFAAEPDIHQPIAMTFDSRGRLWVAENYTYAESALNFDTNLNDRIVILEDRDGDGRHDKRTIFWDQAQKLTSVAVGFDGVYATCPPRLLFIPDRDRDDRPDGPPEVLLDGFDDDKIRHCLANGLKFGPDGWLYGRQGIQGTSYVGKPGTARKDRIAVNGSIWRFHPVTKVFEVVAQGTTNPWGSDWDENGELFFINTVIGHLWHAIPGSWFKRMYGQPFNPYVYEEIDQVADHVHWDTREAWNDINKGTTSSTSEAGGGHAHTGLLLYQGGNWPAEYRNQMFTLNFHGKRINSDEIIRQGASYSARHRPDFMSIDDPYFRGIDLLSGPEGGVYVADWSDIGECHDHNGVHRTSGRIYRITYGAPERALEGDLAERNNLELLTLLSHRNEWFVRQARQLLQERATRGEDLRDAKAELLKLVRGAAEPRLKLRALWALNSVAGTTTELLEELLLDPNEHVRVWAIRLLVDVPPPPSRVLARFARMAAHDASGLVLCYLASALHRIPVEQRWELASALAQRGQFENDRVLPLMVWHGIEASIPASAEKTVELVRESQFLKVARLATLRVFEGLDEMQEAAGGLIALLPRLEPIERRTALLRAMIDGVEGTQPAKIPEGWAATGRSLMESRDPRLRSAAVELDGIFGNTNSLVLLRDLVTESSLTIGERRRALDLLVRRRIGGLEPVLEKLIDDPAMAADAINAYGAAGSPRAPAKLLARYASFDQGARQEVINTLLSRPAWVPALLESVQRGIVPKSAFSATHLRRVRAVGSPEVKERAERIWPSANESESSLYARYRKLLTPEKITEADLARGRELYQLSCAPCHKLYGEGTAIGPELTGSDRGNLDYLLDNILSPSAVVPDAYRVSNVFMKDERVLNGMVVSASNQAVTFQTLTDKMTLPRAEIDRIQESELSMMPEGLLENLDDEQVINLIGYLASDRPGGK